MYYLLFPVFIWSFLTLVSLFFSKGGFQLHPFDKSASISMRAFAAIGIVMVHMPMYIHSPYLPFLQVSSYWNGMITGLFFFLSGYGLLRSYQSKGESYLQHFFKRRVVGGVIIPAIIPVILYLAFDLVETQDVLSDRVHALQTGNFIKPAGWFVQTIIIYYIVFYFTMKKAGNIVKALFIMLLFSFGWIVAIRSLGWNSYIWSSVLAFNSGTFLAYYENDVLHRFMNSPRFMTFALFVISTLELCLFLYQDRIIPTTLNVAIYPLLIVSLIYATGFIRWRWVMFLGEISFEIYLMHLLVLEHSRLWPFNVESWFAVSLLIIVMVSYLIFLLNRRVHTLILGK